MSAPQELDSAYAITLYRGVLAWLEAARHIISLNARDPRLHSAAREYSQQSDRVAAAFISLAVHIAGDALADPKRNPPAQAVRIRQAVKRPSIRIPTLKRTTATKPPAA